MKIEDVLIVARHKFGENAIVEIERITREFIGPSKRKGGKVTVNSKGFEVSPVIIEPARGGDITTVYKVGLVKSNIQNPVWLGMGSDWGQAIAGAEKAIPEVKIGEEDGE